MQDVVLMSFRFPGGNVLHVLQNLQIFNNRMFPDAAFLASNSPGLVRCHSEAGQQEMRSSPSFRATKCQNNGRATAVPRRGVKSPEVDGANPRQDAFFEPLAHPELRFTDGMGPFFRSSSAGVLGYRV